VVLEIFVVFLEIFRWMKSRGTSLGKLWCDSSAFRNFLGIFLCKKNIAPSFRMCCLCTPSIFLCSVLSTWVGARCLAVDRLPNSLCLWFMCTDYRKKGRSSALLFHGDGGGLPGMDAAAASTYRGGEVMRLALARKG
jgi:hypothetical protein